MALRSPEMSPAVELIGGTRARVDDQSSGVSRAEPRAPEEKDRRSCEVRIALVLYGGVSLAIYTNGVVREFFEAVRGRGVYKLIKVLTDSDIVVDVISGTSAGGINGILLAYALCNDREFADCAALWRRDGGIRQLIRSPGRSDGAWDSVLDSEGYYQPALEAALRYMSRHVPETGDLPSRLDELDLYITGTDVDGAVWTQFDDAGHPIDVKEHRAVFTLKHRPRRPAPAEDGRERRLVVTQPFNPRPGGLKGGAAELYAETTYAALAKLARITSCFPAAFAPVHVAPDQDPIRSPDARLQLWGRLGKDCSFLDGGVLDNKPFSHTLKAIFSRSTDRRVARTLFYVEPDPEVFRRTDFASRPNVLQAALASLIGIPGYESISSDLARIAEHNTQIEQYRRIVEGCRTVVEERASATQSTSRPATDRSVYLRSRAVALGDRIVRGVLRQDGRDRVLADEERRAASRLVASFDEALGHPEPILARYDILYRLRRAYHLVYFVYDRLYPSDSASGREPADVAARHLAVLRAFNRQIELLEIVKAAMEGLVDDYPVTWKDAEPNEVWRTVQLIYDALLALPYTSPADCLPSAYQPEGDGPAAAWLDPAALTTVREKLFARADGIVRKGHAGQLPTGPTGPSLMKLVDRYELDEKGISILGSLDRGDVVRAEYERFGDVDALVFPIELVAGIEEKDILKTIRISPRDADKAFSHRGFSDKIAGDALYHFGGFFKRSWRANDILWGRLDGACQLVETLLDRDRIAQSVADPSRRARLRERLASDAFATENLFPRAGRKTQTELREWLLRIASDDPAKRDGALAPAELEREVELVIEATQLEILHNDLPQVLTDALEEQAEWGELASATGRATASAGVASSEAVRAQALVFTPLGKRLDPLVAVAAAAERMRASMRTLEPADGSAPRPRETILGRFFRTSYQVGRESLTRDIPMRVLLESVAVALLVVNKCVLFAFGVQGERLRRTWAYRLAVAMPLQAFYRLTLALRTTSRRRLLLLLGVALAAGATITACVLQLRGVQVTMLPWREPRYSWLIMLGATVVLATAYVLLRLLRPRGYEPSVTHTLAATPRSVNLQAHVVAESHQRRRWWQKRPRLDVRIREATLRPRDPKEPSPSVRRLRVVLWAQPEGVARGPDRTPEPTGGSMPPRVLARGAWTKASCSLVGGVAAVVQARRAHRLRLPGTVEWEDAWLGLEFTAAPARPWPFGRRDRSTIPVHALRYFEDPIEPPELAPTAPHRLEAQQGA